MTVWSRILSVVILLALVLATAPAALGSGENPHALGSTVDVPPGGDLQAALDAAQPGDTIRLTIFRFDDLRTLEIRLGSRIDAKYRIVPVTQMSEQQKRIYQSWLGITDSSRLK